MNIISQSASATTILVDPADMGTWSFANANSSGLVGANPYGSGGMVTGPATPPLGTGSANLATGNGTTGGQNAEILSTTGYNLTPLSSLTALSYSTYDTSNNGQQFPYLVLEVEGTIGGVVNYDQLFFEPPYQSPSDNNPSLPNQGAPALDTWQTWNALEGGWWDNAGICGPGSGVNTLADCTSELTNPEIVNAFGTGPTLQPSVLGGVGGLQFNVGFATTNIIFNGYVDALTVGLNGSDTTYNFDPNPTAAAVPESGTLALLGTGLLGLATLRRRRRRAG